MFGLRMSWEWVKIIQNNDQSEDAIQEAMSYARHVLTSDQARFYFDVYTHHQYNMMNKIKIKFIQARCRERCTGP